MSGVPEGRELPPEAAGGWGLGAVSPRAGSSLPVPRIAAGRWVGSASLSARCFVGVKLVVGCVGLGSSARPRFLVPCEPPPPKLQVWSLGSATSTRLAAFASCLHICRYFLLVRGWSNSYLAISS